MIEQRQCSLVNQCPQQGLVTTRKMRVLLTDSVDSTTPQDSSQLSDNKLVFWPFPGQPSKSPFSQLLSNCLHRVRLPISKKFLLSFLRCTRNSRPETFKTLVKHTSDNTYVHLVTITHGHVSNHTQRAHQMTCSRYNLSLS